MSASGGEATPVNIRDTVSRECKARGYAQLKKECDRLGLDYAPPNDPVTVFNERFLGAQRRGIAVNKRVEAIDTEIEIMTNIVKQFTDTRVIGIFKKIQSGTLLEGDELIEDKKRYTQAKEMLWKLRSEQGLLIKEQADLMFIVTAMITCRSRIDAEINFEKVADVLDELRAGTLDSTGRDCLGFVTDEGPFPDGPMEAQITARYHGLAVTPRELLLLYAWMRIARKPAGRARLHRRNRNRSAQAAAQVAAQAAAEAAQQAAAEAAQQAAAEAAQQAAAEAAQQAAAEAATQAAFEAAVRAVFQPAPQAVFQPAPQAVFLPAPQAARQAAPQAPAQQAPNTANQEGEEH